MDSSPRESCKLLPSHCAQLAAHTQAHLPVMYLSGPRSSVVLKLPLMSRRLLLSSSEVKSSDIGFPSLS